MSGYARTHVDRTITPLTASDLPSLTHLALRALDQDDLPASLLSRNVFGDSGFSARLGLAIRDGAKLVGAAVGVTRRRHEELTGHVKLITVDPSYRRLGIGSALLAELESRLLEEGVASVEVGAESPGYVFPGIDVRYTAALCVFQRRGYVRKGETTNLSVDLVDGEFDGVIAERRLATNGIHLRRLAAFDRAAVEEYFSHRWFPAWRAECLAALDNDPPSGHLALQNGRIVGFSVFDVARPGWFGPVGVDEQLRGMDVGTALTYRCMRDMQQAGYRKIEIAWIGPMYFYSKALGARVCRVYWQYGKELQAGGKAR